MKDDKFKWNDRENDPRWMKDADPNRSEVKYGNGRKMIPGKGIKSTRDAVWLLEVNVDVG